MMQKTFSVAPMMAWTNSHGRDLLRLIDPTARLYSEMITANAILHGDRHNLLHFHPIQHPVALQLAGDNPATLAQAARIGQDYGYDEINLNVGCPSSRATAGCFGAQMMLYPDRIEAALTAMRDAIKIPLTLKCRLGVDDQEPAIILPDLAQRARRAGIAEIIIHARKAWLKGLDPAANRSIPPIDPTPMLPLKDRFPDLKITLNGGLHDSKAIHHALSQFDGVMIGRAICNNPCQLAILSRQITPEQHDIADHSAPPPILILRRLINHLATSPTSATASWRPGRFVFMLFNNHPGARQWRRFLSEQRKPYSHPIDLLNAALNIMRSHTEIPPAHSSPAA